jgi:hypothetical protein
MDWAVLSIFLVVLDVIIVVMPGVVLDMTKAPGLMIIGVTAEQGADEAIILFTASTTHLPRHGVLDETLGSLFGHEVARLPG